MSQVTLRWFSDSPEAGNPSCLCSYCGERIEARPEGEDWETDCEEGEPIRMFSKNLELRFHPRCLNDCISLGILDLK